MTNEEKMFAMMQKKNWALIGATPNPDKMANRIYHAFKDNGYNVMGVNAKYPEMDNGDKIYAALEDLPTTVDCINFVVPPAATLEKLKNLDPKTCSNVWFQSGTFDDEVIRYAEEKGFNCVHEGACTLAFLKTQGGQLTD